MRKHTSTIIALGWPRDPAIGAGVVRRRRRRIQASAGISLEAHDANGIDIDTLIDVATGHRELYVELSSEPERQQEQLAELELRAQGRVRLVHLPYGRRDQDAITGEPAWGIATQAGGIVWNSADSGCRTLGDILVALQPEFGAPTRDAVRDACVERPAEALRRRGARWDDDDDRGLAFRIAFGRPGIVASDGGDVELRVLAGEYVQIDRRGQITELRRRLGPAGIVDGIPQQVDNHVLPISTPRWPERNRVLNRHVAQLVGFPASSR